METIDGLNRSMAIKLREARVLSRAYSTTVSVLIPANFILVVGAALLSLVAGATILIQNSILTNIQSGVLALVGGGFTIIHSKLGCEQYQGECRKLMSFYRGIADEYANLQFVTDPGEFQKRFLALNDQMSAAKKSATAWPFEWANTKAERNFSAQQTVAADRAKPHSD